MTRQFLGIDWEKTSAWVCHAVNCETCFRIGENLRFRSTLTSSGEAEWSLLQKHIGSVHIDQEYCLNCHKWIEDVEFSNHLISVHSTAWRALITP